MPQRANQQSEGGPPIRESRTLSVSNWRAMRQRPAPHRGANGHLFFVAPRPSPGSRLAMFAQAIKSTKTHGGEQHPQSRANIADKNFKQRLNLDTVTGDLIRILLFPDWTQCCPSLPVPWARFTPGFQPRYAVKGPG